MFFAVTWVLGCTVKTNLCSKDAIARSTCGDKNKNASSLALGHFCRLQALTVQNNFVIIDVTLTL